MYLTDKLKEECSLDRLLRDPRTIDCEAYFKSSDFIRLYCEAVCFVIGVHPTGRKAWWEDTLYSAGESAIFEDNKEIHPYEFIHAFVVTNLVDEGTPIFIEKGSFHV